MEAITQHFGSIVLAIELDCVISAPHTPATPSPTKISIKATVDTGCMITSIKKSVLDRLGLHPIGTAKQVGTGGGLVNSYPYLLDIELPNNIEFHGLYVHGLENMPVDMLIGMDILTFGDLVITNSNNETVLNFQIPATHKRFNFEEDVKYKKIYDLRSKHGNTKCPCNSGKEFKNCHGKNLE